MIKLPSVTLLTILFLTAHLGLSKSQETIKIGMSTALTGPAEALGNGVKDGVLAYFDHINASGGIHGYKIDLIALDDGYEPIRTAPNMRKLINKDKVFAILGNVGTPTASVSVPISNELKTPFFGAFTGAGLLRKNPPERYIFNYRASYAQETAAMVNGFVKDLGIKPSEIAFFTQNDGYGDAGYRGGIKALKDLGFNQADRLVHGRYTRNTVDIEDGLLQILENIIKPKAIIMVGAYKPCASFIKLAKEEGLTETFFANVSFVGSKALAKELGKNTQNVIVTQVVPHFQDQSYPVVKEFHSVVPKKHQGFVSLEGFIAAKAFVQALTETGKKPSKESFIETLEKMTDFDLGLKTKHTLSQSQHQISHKVWPTKIVNGKYESFEWSRLN